MIYKYSFKYLFIGEIVYFASHNKSLMYKLLIRRILLFDPEKCIILLFLDSDFVENTRILFYI
jgi:hypothetical protein